MIQVQCSPITRSQISRLASLVVAAMLCCPSGKVQASVAARCPWVESLERDRSDVVLDIPAGAEPPCGFADNDPWHVAAMTDRDKEAVIACLLSAEGNTRLSNVSGVIDPHVSQLVEQATVELSALYMASYVITGRFDHANAVAIRDDAVEGDGDGEQAMHATDQHVLRRAYVAYRDWFAELRKVGWRTMVSQRPGPLVEAGLHWY